MFTTINPIYSPESISFQNPHVHIALTKLIDESRKGLNDKTVTAFEIALSKLIKDYTNMNFSIEVGALPLSTEPPRIDQNNPLMEGYNWKNIALSKQGLSDIRKSDAKEVRGLLDPNGAMVHGYFADLPPAKMHIPQVMLTRIGGRVDFTSAEISAGILHEVGHHWSFFELLTHFRTTNQILVTMGRLLEGSEDHGKRELIIKEASSALDIPAIDAVDLSTKANTTIYTVIVSNLARNNRSQSGQGGYDINSWEALSDQYATRMGAGRDLVTALDKMSRGTIHRRGWAGYFFMEFVKVALAGMSVAQIALGISLGGALPLYVLVTLLLVDSQNDWYDKTGYRFKRIRNQLIEELKDPTLPKSDSARIREDIEVIDTVNSEYKDHVQLLGLVYDYLMPSGIGKRKDIQFQQNLEELASNKLFLYANTLKHAD